MLRRSFTLLRQNESKSTPVVATLSKGPAILQTSSVSRPAPSLFSLNGLRSLPYWTQWNEQASCTQVAYNDPYVNAIVHHFESVWEEIRDEYNNAVEQRSLPPSDYQTTTEHAKLHDGTWDWHSYLRKGTVVPPDGPFHQNFPFTAKRLDEVGDDLFTGTPFGYAFLSTLHPSSNIQPHTSPMNLRLRLHLGLSVPPSCGITVAGIQRSWQEGKALVLDDSYAHAVWNEHANMSRVILLVDVWHPDIPPSERKEIQEMFRQAEAEGWLSSQ